MKCRCGKKAIYYQRTSGLYLCKKCFSKSVEKRFRRNIRIYNMIERGERVAVGVSGGKDSLVLLNLLNDLNLPFEIVVISIDEGIKGYRDKSLEAVKKNTKILGVEHKIYKFKDFFGINLDDVTGKLTMCSYCGVLRRYVLNKTSRELGCSKLAVGHNLDDEAQSILMNLLRGDFSKLGRCGFYYRNVSEKFVPRIKPLRTIPEKEILLYAIIKKIVFDSSLCPYAPQAFRNDVRDFLNMMESKRPNTKNTLLKSYDKLFPILQKKLTLKLRDCKICGEPSISDICKVCEMKEEFK